MSQLSQYTPEERTIRAKIRLDFKGAAKPGKFLFKGKSVERLAEEAREQNVSVFRNIPLQGVYILDVDMGTEVYTVYDDVNNMDTAYAPVVLDVAADSVEDLLKLVAREEFRKIEVISPGEITLGKVDIEKLLFKFAEELKINIANLERKYNYR